MIELSKLWSIDIFEESFNPFQVSLSNLIAVFNAKKLRIKKKHVHTYADPFLVSHYNKLYLFAEIQEIGGKGYINLWESDNAKEWKNNGVVLKGSSHFSYPFIFQDKSKEYYLIPEAGENREIAIYGFKNFPFGVTKKSTLLNGFFADSNIQLVDNVYYLSTTNLETNCFEIYYSTNLLSGSWIKHPANPVTSDKSISRSGGGFIQYDNKIFRIAQDCSEVYGGGIIILEVLVINRDNYQERIVYSDNSNNESGLVSEKRRHHLSIASFKGRTIIASDFLQNDYWINKLPNYFFKLLK